MLIKVEGGNISFHCAWPRWRFPVSVFETGVGWGELNNFKRPFCSATNTIETDCLGADQKRYRILHLISSVIIYNKNLSP